jgi:hypothetical protein
MPDPYPIEKKPAPPTENLTDDWIIQRGSQSGATAAFFEIQSFRPNDLF